MLAWHFLREDRKLNYPPHTLVEAGETYTSEGKLELCANGMHASVRAIDALQYAPGAIICRVELSGEVLTAPDKLCARHRKVLWMADATNILHEFACWCAEQALTREREAGREPDARSWAAVEAKRRWLKGEITGDELSAARDAACSAAWDVAWYAAWDAQNEQLEKMFGRAATMKLNDSQIRSALIPRRRWNWRKAWDNLLTVAGVGSFAVICYMAFCELTGR